MGSLAPSALSAVPALPSVDGRPLHFAYETIEAPQRAVLRTLARRIRAGFARSVAELVAVGDLLAEAHEQLQGHSGGFEAWCNTEFQMDVRVARRLIRGAEFAAKHSLALDGANLPVSALYLLSGPTVPEDVIADVIAIAKTRRLKGREVQDMLREARSTVDQADERMQEAFNELSTAQADVATLTELNRELELAAFKARDHADRAAAALARAKAEEAAGIQEIVSLQSQVAGLRKQLEQRPVDTVEKEVEKVPDGYRTLEEALRAQERAIADAQQRHLQLQQEVADAQKRLAALRGEAADAEANAHVLQSLCEAVEAIAQRFPAALLATVRRTKDTRSAGQRLATLLRAMATQLDEGL